MAVVTGWAVIATWIGYLLQWMGWLPWWLVATVVWCACVLLWKGLSFSAKRQSLVLLLVGAGGLLFAASQGVYLPVKDVLAVNIPLLAMFVAVSMLSLTAPQEEVEKAPGGSRAVAATAVGTHLLGAVINLSVVFIFGDRLQRSGKLSDTQLMVISRAFCAAAWWSPFFVATGVAVTYSPGMQWSSTVGPGLLMAVVAITLTWFDVRLRQQARSFQGYPIHLSSLLMPVLLALAVMVAHGFWPHVSIMVLISLFAPVGAALFMTERPRLQATLGFVHGKLANIGNQFALFLAAGVFSSGIKALIAVYPDVVQLQAFSFGAGMFMLLSGLMIFAGLVGAHPVVTIAIVSPLVLPLNPDPNMLAFMFVTTWAVSTASSPLSGIGLALVSRYHASPLGILRQNWYYALIMWLLSSVASFYLF